jgi:hypothetical protein
MVQGLAASRRARPEIRHLFGILKISQLLFQPQGNFEPH